MWVRKKAVRQDRKKKKTKGVRGEGSARSEVTERTLRWRGAGHEWVKVKGLPAHSFRTAWPPGVNPSSQVCSPIWRGRLERLLDLGLSCALLFPSHSFANLRPPRSEPYCLATAPKMGQTSRNGLMPPAPRPLDPQGHVVLVLIQQECLVTGYPALT